MPDPHPEEPPNAVLQQHEGKQRGAVAGAIIAWLLLAG